MKIRHFPLFSTSSDSSSSNWFDKNADFVKEEVEEKPRIMKGKRKDQGGKNMGKGNSPKSFRDDFRGTRVFVQGIPDGVRWQEVRYFFDYTFLLYFQHHITEFLELYAIRIP